LAIAYLGSTKRADYVEHIEKRFDDEDDECLANAVAAYCNLTQERCAPTINRFLSHQDPKVKAAAIAGLIRYGGLEGILNSASALKEMIESGSPEQRKNAAVVLGLIKIQSFHQSVLKLMDDRDPEVRRQGAAAAGELGSPELLPRLLELLGDGYVHSTAVKALSRRGAEILDDLVKLYENPASNRMQRLGAVKTLASIRSQEAFDALIKALPEKDEKLESAIINALAHARLKRPDIIVDAPKVRSLIHAQFSVFYQKLLDEESAAKFLPSKLLDDTIKDNRRLALTSIYGLLSLIYPPRMIEVIAYDLKSSNASIRANALEIIDNAFDSEIRTLLLAAVDNVSLQTKLEQAEKFFRLKEKSPDELVEEFLSSSDSWLAASALNAIAENGLREFSAKARDFLKSEDPLLRETALFVMSRFETAETLAAAAREAAQDPDSTVRAYAKSFAA